MCHTWLRVAIAAVCLMAIGGCDSSQKQAPETQSKSETSSGSVGEQKPEGGAEQPGQDAAGADAGASQPVQDNQSLWVMEARGNKQCEGGGKSLAASGAELAQNGIRVQESRCAVRTDRMYPAVCGGATGDVLMHRIPASFLDAALELGFDPAKEGQYQFTDCAQATSGSAPQQR
ncbi:hypothetical protein [Microbulbifer sp. YPW1]|uniref:hypothetical protein n=1 Tax=Microbulbifer sp. YPW1 TaxID=2745199 RepID=UPI0015982B7B|nr:hypothetical protein [Microbulbifer sp. YPW1]QKX18710.1 hypothetical protein HUW35_18020 [Microbulbifer sp. YPW1]